MLKLVFMFVTLLLSVNIDYTGSVYALICLNCAQVGYREGEESAVKVSTYDRLGNFIYMPKTIPLFINGYCCTGSLVKFTV